MLNSPKACKSALFVSWIFTIVTACPPILGWGSYERDAWSVRFVMKSTKMMFSQKVGFICQQAKRAASLEKSLGNALFSAFLSVCDIFRHLDP